MKVAILDAATLGEDLSMESFERFGEVFVYPITTEEQLPSRLAEVDTVIINKVKLNAGNLIHAKKLSLICITATGFDNVDLEYCRAHGIAVCNVVGYSTQSVAQVTVSMALSLITHLPEYHRFVAGGEYTRSGKFNCLTPVFHEIAGKTWGIVGYGNIGKQVARVAEALGCRVLVYKRTPVAEATCVDFDTICKESDILSLHIPLNEGTFHLLDRDHIGMLKKDAIVINVARGAVADEAALTDAILEERIGALGVDVYSVEPMGPQHPFQKILAYPNVCLTPHMAWGGYETRVRLLDEVAQNMDSFLQGGTRCRVDL